jgi:pyruvate formate-lyase activating enzyme-like uncharacterized protein
MILFTRKSVPSQIASSLSDTDIQTIRLDLGIWASAVKEEFGVLMAKKIEEEHAKISVPSLPNVKQKVLIFQPCKKTRPEAQNTQPVLTL